MGRVVDPETALIYLRARYYDPATAQFLTRDPAATITRSAYGYVNSNPLNGSDPTGLFQGCGSDQPFQVVSYITTGTGQTDCNVINLVHQNLDWTSSDILLADPNVLAATARAVVYTVYNDFYGNVLDGHYRELGPAFCQDYVDEIENSDPSFGWFRNYLFKKYGVSLLQKVGASYSAGGSASTLAGKIFLKLLGVGEGKVEQP